jgi:hypothetical protein
MYVAPPVEQRAIHLPLNPRIRAPLEAASKMIGSYDTIVAATAMARTRVVATFNTRHFDNAPGLRDRKKHFQG